VRRAGRTNECKGEQRQQSALGKASHFLPDDTTAAMPHRADSALRGKIKFPITF
jgi:hypothetical protein